MIVGSVKVHIVGGMVRSNHCAVRRVFQSYPVGNTISAGIGAEIVVEAFVLLHDKNKMLDFIKPGCCCSSSGSGGGFWRAAAGSD